MTNIVFIWTGVTSYMADCWRELAARPDVRLKVVIEERRAGRATAFDAAKVLAGLDATVRFDDEPPAPDVWRRTLAGFHPDILFIVGWHAATCRFFAEDDAFRDVPKVLVFDLPFAWTIRKLLAPLALRSYLRRFSAAFVPGARAARYARWLGFPPDRIIKGLFAVGRNVVAPAAARTGGFLYVGRYAPEKRLDVLMTAYRRYRERAAEPWPLTCCGMGPEAGRLAHVDGVVDRGFLQPDEVRALYARSGALVLASDFDPWPLVILESVANGLPVICTAACGDVDEFVKDNGIVCRTGDARALADAMARLQMNAATFAAAGGAERARAEPYFAARWADRVVSCLHVVQAGRE